MASSAPEAPPRPFVDTSLARWISARIQLTHEERGITVISGPYGIGKTTAIDNFAAANEFGCAVVKIEATTTKRGASPINVLQLIIESIRKLNGHKGRHTLSGAFWHLRHMLYNEMDNLMRRYYDRDYTKEFENGPLFTLILDEAQYLSREAIDMLRFWNDNDRCTTPIPVGLVFIGNDEFSLKEDSSGTSILSGAVRSRALFVETLDYSVISDNDIALFVRSRGITDASAIDAFSAYFSKVRVSRDLRQLEKKVAMIIRRAGGGSVTGELVRSILTP